MRTVNAVPSACPDCGAEDFDRRDALGAVWLFCNARDCLWMDAFDVIHPQQAPLFGDRQLPLSEVA